MTFLVDYYYCLYSENHAYTSLTFNSNATKESKMLVALLLFEVIVFTVCHAISINYACEENIEIHFSFASNVTSFEKVELTEKTKK